LPGCISCGTCEAVCPEVFEITNVSVLKNDADFQANEESIREAAEICPISVIDVEDERDDNGE
jgi:ferredoxin